MKVLKSHKTVSGFLVVPIHYSVSPDRGPEWVANAKKGYAPDAWDREMEIDFTKTEEKRVYKFFGKDIHGKKLVYNKEFPILRGWDFGYNTSACVLAQWNPTKDQLGLLGEVIIRDGYIHEQKQTVVDYCNRRFPEAFYIDYCDIAGTFKSEKSEKTDVEVLNDGNIAFVEIYPMSTKADVNRGLTSVRNLLALRKDGSTGLVIDVDECPVLVRGFSGEYVLGNDDKPKRDQHPVDDPQDALRYIVDNYSSTTLHNYKSEEDDDVTEEKLAQGFRTSNITGYLR